MVVQNKIFNYYFGGLKFYEHLKFLGSIKFLKTSIKKKKT
jgi:hypothetical protein